MKGVNKLVVEVRADDEYFEKALLFIKPGKSALPQKDISAGAEKLLSDISSNKNYRKSKTTSPILLVFSGIAAGSAVSWVIIFLIGILH